MGTWLFLCHLLIAQIFVLFEFSSCLVLLLGLKLQARLGSLTVISNDISNFLNCFSLQYNFFQIKTYNLCHLINKISSNVPSEVIITQEIYISDKGENLNPGFIFKLLNDGGENA